MVPQYAIAVNDIATGVASYRMWGRLGWREIRRRYRRTTIGPFWGAISLAIFTVIIGLVWAQLWNQDPKIYLPYLTAGMILWIWLNTILCEGAGEFILNDALIKQLRIPYTLLVCTVLWRNSIVLGHNFLIYVLVCVYAGIIPTWNTALIIPGAILLCANILWITLALALMNARYRDIQYLVASILQVAMFVTPILWDRGRLSGPLSALVDYNPLYQYIEVMRAPLMGRAPEPWTWIVMVASAIAGWAVTLYLFSRFRRRIPYWL
jgi:ABC-type polysaccharide/polyol phosphate export permease